MNSGDEAIEVVVESALDRRMIEAIVAAVEPRSAVRAIGQLPGGLSSWMTTVDVATTRLDLRWVFGVAASEASTDRYLECTGRATDTLPG